MIWLFGDFKNLPGKTASEKAVRHKTFNIAKNPKYDGCQRRLASGNFLIKNLLLTNGQKLILKTSN